MFQACRHSCKTDTLSRTKCSLRAVADGSGSALSPPRWVRQPWAQRYSKSTNTHQENLFAQRLRAHEGRERAVGFTACGPIPRCIRILTNQVPRLIKETTLLMRRRTLFSESLHNRSERMRESTSLNSHLSALMRALTQPLRAFPEGGR